MNVLELYSGIGGMHLALKESGVAGEVVASIEINNAANEIYTHNFPGTKLLNMNIEGLTSDFINKLNVNTILMSPPCQPFTRNGLQNDKKDPRSASFLHILEILPELNSVTKILIENVKGFEESDTRNILLETLKSLQFSYQEFILSPHQIGIPNSRHRYYCLAKKASEKFSFQVQGEIISVFPHLGEEKECFKLSTIVEHEINKNYFLSETVLLKRLGILDICYLDSRRSCCFTKAYGRYLEGTGSILTNKTENELKDVIEKIKLTPSECEKLKLLKSLNLRFFTPKEICRLMCFPEIFVFPNNVSNRKKYMLLGNSINVKVVAELIKLLNS